MTTQQARPLIVVFEDDLGILALVKRALSREYEVAGFETVEEGLSEIGQASLILSDFQMPGMGGRGVLKMVKSGQITKPVLIMSSLEPDSPALEGVRDLDLPFLAKPFSPTLLRASIAKLISTP